VSLNWNVSRCDDFSALMGAEEWPKTERTIFATMAVGIGKITEENWSEFYARYAIICLFDGVTPLSPEDVHRRIGLSTNVATETWVHWVKRIVANERDTHKRAAVLIVEAARVLPTEDPYDTADIEAAANDLEASQG